MGKEQALRGLFPQWAAKLSSTDLHSPFSEGLSTVLMCEVLCAGGLHAPEILDVVGGFVHT